MISNGSTVKVRGRRNLGIVIGITDAASCGWKQDRITVQFASGHVVDVPAEDVREPRWEER